MSNALNLDFSPRGYFVEYPLLVNIFVKDIINTFQADFRKVGSAYVLKRRIANKNLAIWLKESIKQTLKECSSLMSNRFPECKNKICIIAESGDLRRMSYAMVENDIKVNIEQIVKVAKKTFDDFFIGKNHFAFEETCFSKVIWCKHNWLCAKDWKELLNKKFFGKKRLSDFQDEERWIKKEKIVIEEILKEDFTLSKEEEQMIVANAADWLQHSLNCS